MQQEALPFASGLYERCTLAGSCNAKGSNVAPPDLAPVLEADHIRHHSAFKCKILSMSV